MKKQKSDDLHNMQKILTKSRQLSSQIVVYERQKHFSLGQECDRIVNDAAYTLHQEKWRLKIPWHGSIKNALKFLQ